MPIKEITSQMVRGVAVAAQSISSSTTTAGSGIDIANYPVGFNFTMHTGARTDGTYTLLIEESDDNSTFTAVADDDLVKQDESSSVAPEAQTALAAANSTSKIGYIGAKRYVKASIVSTSVTNGAIAGVIYEGAARSIPA